MGILMITNKERKYYYGTGRRKTSKARVFISEGTGQIHINKKNKDDYFKSNTANMIIKEPLKLLKIENKFDLKITVIGGGMIGQAGAIRHGLTRALISYDKEMESEIDKDKILEDKKEKTVDEDEII